MERQQFVGGAARAFRIDADVANVLLQIVCRGQYGPQGIAVVFPVNGEITHRVRNSSSEGDVHIGRLGDKSDVICPQGSHHHQRVEH